MMNLQDHMIPRRLNVSSHGKARPRIPRALEAFAGSGPIEARPLPEGIRFDTDPPRPYAVSQWCFWGLARAFTSMCTLMMLGMESSRACLREADNSSGVRTE